MSSEEQNVTHNIEWLKMGKVSSITFVGNNVVAFGTGCFIILCNIETNEEIVYEANSQSTGEGVKCLVGYHQGDMFAFSEMSPNPRIFLVQYPSFSHVNILQDHDHAHNYEAMGFGELECLVCLSGIPTFQIIVWCWRTRVKLAIHDSGLNSSEITLQCSPTMPIRVSILAKDEQDSEFQLYQVNICSSLCRLSMVELKLSLDKDIFVSSFSWAPDGSLFIADTAGNLCMMRVETNSFIKVHSWPYMVRESSILPTITHWWKGGIVMSGPNGFIQYVKRVSNNDFQPGWCITNKGPLLLMTGNQARDKLVGWSSKNVLVQLNITDQIATLNQIKHHGQEVRLISMVHPLDNYLASITIENNLITWDKKSGNQIGLMEIGEGFVLDMASNPKFPYLVLGRSDGVLQIVAVTEGHPFQLSEIALCPEEITGVTFNDQGSLIIAASYKIGRIFVTQGLIGTGNKINVLNHHLTNESIVDMHVISSAVDQHKLLLLVNDDCNFPSGDQLNIYSLPKLQLENRIKLSVQYGELACVNNNLIAVPYLSRMIHHIDTNSNDGEVKIIRKLASGHQIRRYHININNNQFLTFGWDGKIFVRDVETLTPICVLQSHHRFNNGVKYAIADSKSEYVISLGKDGNLICSKILTGFGNNKMEVVDNSSYETYFQKKSPIKASSTVFVKKTWLEMQKQQKINLDAAVAAPQIKDIMNDFKNLQKELVHLLDENYRAPHEEQLDILEFDLDLENREARFEEAAIKRDNVQRLLEAESLDCDLLAEVIKMNTWDTMEVKSRCIKAMLKDFKVYNYGLPPNPPNFMDDFKWTCESRRITIEMSERDHYEPWFPIADEERKTRSTPTSPEEMANEKEQVNSLFGSSSNQFVEISPLHCSQFEMCSSFSNASEIILLEKVCIDLREDFNKLFDETFLQKEKEMALLTERNNRLRTILSELRVTCNAPMDVKEPEDPKWSSEEMTETIVTINDNEVQEKPYISPSQQDLLDKKAAEKERIRQLLLADNFRDMALIEMMDGMLEVRWEDELKKEIPKPKCMIDKDPSDYNEADLKAIKEYEEKCRVLISEKERYKKMLEIEYKKLENLIQDSLNKFDSTLFDLFLLKLKYDAAMNHEQLKILRIHQINDDRIRREMQEKEIVNNVLITERCSENAYNTVSDMQAATEDCRNNYESLLQKDKILGKRFKQEFLHSNATAAVLEHLAKYFKRRPKLHHRASQSPTLLLELARCVVENDHTSFMPLEYQEFLTALDTLDLPSSTTQHFDDSVWAILVRARRAKIESELKVRAYALELKEAESTLDVVIKDMKSAKEHASLYVAELRAAREQKLRLSRDLQIQIVMKQGFVEAPLTGHISDFKNAILINPTIVEKMNKFVKAAGAKKLDAMKMVTKYHRVNKYKEWEYKKMKMECEDLEDNLNNIQSIKVTLEVKQYLKDLLKPREKEIHDEDANFLKQTEDNYKNAVKRIKDEIAAVDTKIKSFKHMNSKADSSILDLKCDVSEQQLERDLKLEEVISEASQQRMAMIVKRSQLVAKIQHVHHDNLVLQAELELLQLRTYPTLKYKSQI